jgi:hypothetical protein
LTGQEGDSLVNKSVLKVVSISDKGDHKYWKRKSYLKRIAALEQLRRIIFGYDKCTARLQRTLTVTELKKH